MALFHYKRPPSSIDKHSISHTTVLQSCISLRQNQRVILVHDYDPNFRSARLPNWRSPGPADGRRLSHPHARTESGITTSGIVDQNRKGREKHETRPTLASHHHHRLAQLPSVRRPEPVSDRTPSASSPAPAAAAGEEGDDDVEQADDAGNDGVQYGADAVHDGHDAVADGAEDGFNLGNETVVSFANRHHCGHDLMSNAGVVF